MVFRNLGKAGRTHRKVSSSRPVATKQPTSPHRRLLPVEPTYHPLSPVPATFPRPLPKNLPYGNRVRCRKADFEAPVRINQGPLSCRNGSWKRKREEKAVRKGQGDGQEACGRPKVDGHPYRCARVSLFLPKSQSSRSQSLEWENQSQTWSTMSGIAWSLIPPSDSRSGAQTSSRYGSSTRL